MIRSSTCNLKVVFLADRTVYRTSDVSCRMSSTYVGSHEAKKEKKTQQVRRQINPLNKWRPKLVSSRGFALQTSNPTVDWSVRPPASRYVCDSNFSLICMSACIVEYTYLLHSSSLVVTDSFLCARSSGGDSADEAVRNNKLAKVFRTPRSHDPTTV